MYLYPADISHENSHSFALGYSYRDIDDTALIDTHASVLGSTLAISLSFVLPEPDNDVLRLLRLILEIILEDALCARSVSGLRVESSARIVGNHAIATSKRVLHRAPNMVLGGWLHIPDITLLVQVSVRSCHWILTKATDQNSRRFGRSRVLWQRHLYHK